MARRDQLDSLLDEAARANLSARETLILLCEREIARKDHRRIDMALKLAHFPGVELAGFDFEAQPSIDPNRSETWPRHVGSPTGRTCCCSAGRASARRTCRSRSGGRRSWRDTQCSSRRRRRWWPASPKPTANYAGRVRQESEGVEGEPGGSCRAHRAASAGGQRVPHHAGKSDFACFSGCRAIRAFENRAEAPTHRRRVFEPPAQRKKARIFTTFAFRPDGQPGKLFKLAGVPEYSSNRTIFW